jgi:heme-degrading monooxygenase HmoA
MPVISKQQHMLTLINTFTVAPERQEELVNLLIEATDQVMKRLPGFVSANIHRGLDGRHVANYAQWRSRDDLEAMLRHPAALPHLKEATALAIAVDPHVYDVAAVREKARVPRIPSRLALRAAATGALALGAFAVGALAIGRVAIGAIAVKRAALRKLSIEDVEIGRLGVRELVVEHR